MDIIYISTLSSKRFINHLYEQTGQNPGFAVQKFSRLVLSGLIQNNQSVMALSNPPITRSNSKKVFQNIKEEVEDKIEYKYIPFLNIPFIKHACIFIYTFFYALFWGCRNRKNKCIICDTLSISASLAALLATKINRVKCCGVFTDIYGLMVRNNTSKSYIKKTAKLLNSWYNNKFTHYVLLTEAMNSVVNLNKRPYIVMEALCDEGLKYSNILCEQKSYPKILLYAGGIEEIYGIKMLVEAFKEIEDESIELHIYGNGSYVKQLEEECLIDSRIKYMGVKPNDIIVDAEQKATLLVNPRFTTEEFTKYSFPSKNMEYMASGTALLTTNLPGMPIEYHDYVFLFEEESIQGYAKKIHDVMSLDTMYLMEYGARARQFVLEKKNNIVQSSRIISLVS